MDWDEVTSADDDNTVVVEEIEGILTDEQFEEFLVRHFAAAKAFVALVYAHHSVIHYSFHKYFCQRKYSVDCILFAARIRPLRK